MFSTVPVGMSVLCAGITVVLPFRGTYMCEPLAS